MNPHAPRPLWLVPPSPLSSPSSPSAPVVITPSQTKGTGEDRPNDTHIEEAEGAAPAPAPAPAPNPSGRRFAKPAATLPHDPAHRTLMPLGRCLTADEWRSLRALRDQFPDACFVRGERHPDGGNLYFWQYHRASVNGEVWVSKEQLAKSRAAANAAVRRYHAKRMQTDPAYRAECLDQLNRLIERRRAIEDADREGKDEGGDGGGRARSAKRKQRGRGRGEGRGKASRPTSEERAQALAAYREQRRRRLDQGEG